MTAAPPAPRAAPRSALGSPWIRKALAVVAVLVAANLLLGAVGPSLPDPVVYPTREIQLAVDRLEARTEAGCVDVLVTGNSVAGEALSAQALAQAWGLRSGVVSVIPGSVASIDVDWMNTVTLPRARPGTIVYLASPLMFVPDELAGRYGLSIYRRAVETRGGWAGDLQRWAVDELPLAKYRLVLADPQALVDGLRGDLPESYDEIIGTLGWRIDEDGHIRSTGVSGADGAFLDALEDAKAAIGDEWRIDDAQRDVLREQFVRLEEGGQDVVMVIPPVTDALEAAFPGGASGFEDYLAEARSVGEGTGVTTVDLSAGDYDPSLFRDTHHLNEQGSNRLTSDVIVATGSETFASCEDVP